MIGVEVSYVTNHDDDETEHGDEAEHGIETNHGIEAHEAHRRRHVTETADIRSAERRQ